MNTTRIKASYPRAGQPRTSQPHTCGALGVCQAKGPDGACTHGCLIGHASLHRACTLRTHNGGEQVGHPTATPTAPADESATVGGALTWLLVAAVSATLAACVGLMAGAWGL